MDTFVAVVYVPRERDKYPGDSVTRVAGYKMGFKTREEAKEWVIGLNAYDYGLFTMAGWISFIGNFGDFYSVHPDLEVT
jgi:hypothetical protein